MRNDIYFDKENQKTQSTKRKNNFSSNSKIKFIKNSEKPIQRLRFIVQIISVLLSIWIGIEFILFINFLESGGRTIYVERPSGVEGYLPISSLMSLRYFLETGEIHWAHPAGMFIFSAIVLLSLVIGKSFCSWLCPIGFISENLGDFGEKIFKRKIKIPKIIDLPLRSIKYLLLGFFIYIIFFVMDLISLKIFLDSPYNQVADIKMYYFFAKISKFSLTVIVILALLSTIFRNFWCRYLCPYGALLGLVGLLSPFKIKREVSTCIDCNKCTKVCPNFIDVANKKIVISDECTSCMNCVDACPVKDTLYVNFIPKKSRLNKRFVAIIVVGIFMFVTGLGMITGNWKNKIKLEDYFRHMERINSSEYSHPTGVE
ncbi:MAG: 4Fe-4S binding protein [Ignavibacteria bacterium]|nr:4Fe-4S binding protein [Ignavibacteria bacterium]